MDGHFSPPSPCSRSCASGFTLLELLVALAVAGVLVGSALTIALSSRDMMTADEQRTRLNQSLRGGLDLLGIDIRQSGERLPDDFPAIEIVDGASGAPDTLVLRRNLLDEVLPLCETLTATTVQDTVRVADDGADPPQGCAPVGDDDGDGWPDNIGSWRGYRLIGGGAAPVYVYNPVDRVGEWFLFDDDAESNVELHKGNDDPWQTTYEIDQQARVYMLEERRYGLADDLLQFTLDMETEPVHVSAYLTDFQVRAVMDDGSMLDTFDADDDWTRLRSIEVSVEARVEDGEEGMTRRLTARFFPRNILSN